MLFKIMADTRPRSPFEPPCCCSSSRRLSGDEAAKTFRDDLYAIHGCLLQLREGLPYYRENLIQEGCGPFIEASLSSFIDSEGQLAVMIGDASEIVYRMGFEMQSDRDAISSYLELLCLYYGASHAVVDFDLHQPMFFYGFTPAQEALYSLCIRRGEKPDWGQRPGFGALLAGMGIVHTHRMAQSFYETGDRSTAIYFFCNKHGRGPASGDFPENPLGSLASMLRHNAGLDRRCRSIARVISDNAHNTHLKDIDRDVVQKLGILSAALTENNAPQAVHLMDEIMAGLDAYMPVLTHKIKLLDGLEQFGNVPLLNTARQACEMLAPLIHNKGLQFQMALGKSLEGATIWGSPDSLYEIFANLLSNACKYTAEGRIDFTISLIFVGSRAMARIRVQDTGIGIPLKDQPHIFARRFRASNVGAIDGDGQGLGFVAECVSKMGGSVDYESANPGSIFEIYLPVTLILAANLPESGMPRDSHTSRI